MNIDTVALNNNTKELRRIISTTHPGNIRADIYLADKVAALGYKGVLEILKNVVDYRYETPLIPSPEGVAEAGGNGHLDIVEYCKDNFHIRPTPDILIRAAENGHKDVVKYALYNFFYDDSEILEAARISAKHKNWELLMCFVLSNFEEEDD
jgi:hypothetical protein